MTKTSDALCQAAHQLCDALRELTFSPPVHCVYNPFEYAWKAYRSYVERYARSRKRVLYLGMNPGPWGMAQTGVPFGEVRAVREWLQIDAPIDRPDPEHPKRPIAGMQCTRSEVSGRRLWGLFAGRFGNPGQFFREQFVANYCPLVFMDEGGRNVTPDKIPSGQFEPLRDACDEHLLKTLDVLCPESLVGVGQFAEQCLARVAERMRHPPQRVIRILHPSPASPAANRDWAGSVEKVLIESGIWEKK